MAGTGPKLAQSPLELLTEDDGTRKPFILHNVWGYLVGGALCLGGSLFATHGLRRPLMSGMQRTIGITVFGALLGNYAHERRELYYAERDAVLRHYVQLHPDDFPPYERKKFAEVLEPWIPIR
ncbi:hypothetical protein WA026_006420 [Henosepilachna vigintioctopunctata]|uniref:NADH dehydrogenase [ubiquinone] 1 subunit C2 n=1 Tax=Henosepilachna vigintioctopunctata TaxID=420089 RepID=A0AAW1TRD4_9CUCU